MEHAAKGQSGWSELAKTSLDLFNITNEIQKIKRALEVML